MTDQPPPIDHAARVSALEQELALARATADARLVKAELKAEALRAGIIDLDCLKLLDTTDLTIDENGAVPDAGAAITRLKRDKPWVFAMPNSSHPAAPPTPEPPRMKTAMEMSDKEWRQARAQLIRRQPM